MVRDLQYEKDKKDDKRATQETRVADKLESFILARCQEFWETEPSYGLLPKYRKEVIDMILKALKRKQ